MTNTESFLSPYRVLDLTDDQGYLCGKILGGLGAEIIKIEPPGGDRGRRVTLLVIKIHGGVGITQEYELQFCFRKANAAETAFGDGDYHREFVALSLHL
jgi:hypothetical protein